MNLSNFLKEAVNKEASDIHLKVDSPPVLRIGKDLVNLDYPALTASDIEKILSQILDETKLKRLKETREMDIAYVAHGIGRFRVDMFYQRNLPGIVMRRVKEDFQDFSYLNLPDVLKKICDLSEGIVIVCGPARSGKSTTIAAMLNHINLTRRMHIITVEDPIEFLYEDKKSIIDQREIGIDTSSFSTALKYVMREDPDLVFIGEMRDKESFQTALSVAETGHLVFTTVHANGSAQVVDRVLDYIPLGQRDNIRLQLANNLKAVMVQQLLPRKEGFGFVPVVEVMIANSMIKKLIRENKLTKLTAAVELGANEGMQTFNQSLLKLIQSNIISEEVAFSKSPNPEILKLNQQGIFLTDAKKILEG